MITDFLPLPMLPLHKPHLLQLETNPLSLLAGHDTNVGNGIGDATNERKPKLLANCSCTKLCVDGYNKQTNTIYEFQGDFWHGNPDIYNLDAINNKLNITFQELYDKTLKKIHRLKMMGYNVIYIWENDWTKGIKAIKKLQKLWKKSK
jgi:hypothetical protein